MSLADEWVKTHANTEAVVGAWTLMKALHNPPEPMIDHVLHGTAVQFSWSYSHVYLEIDVFPDGRVAWFGRDRETGESDGTEDEDPLQHFTTAIVFLAGWFQRLHGHG